jgi:hypothetical protein
LKFGPLPPVPKTARFTLRYQATGGPAATNHFYMRYTNSLSSADALTMLTTLANSWNTRMAPLTVPNWTLVQTQVNDLDSRTGVESGLVVSHPGTAAGNTLGAAVSFVLSFKTALKYRGGHARVYVPGITAAEESDVNTWSPAGQGAVFTAFTGMISDLGASPPVGVGAVSQVAVRYISSNKADFTPAPPTTPPPWLLTNPMVLPVTAIVTNPQFASQRRRNQQ